MTARSLHRAATAERAGLCQLSHDVMIYFEEVMSGLCSEAGRVQQLHCSVLQPLLLLLANANLQLHRLERPAQKDTEKII